MEKQIEKEEEVSDKKKFRVYLSAKVPHEASFIVRASTAKEARSIVQKEIEDDATEGWGTKYWQTGKFEPLYDMAEGLCISDVAPECDVTLTKEETKAIDSLRDRGFSVIVWTPEELGDIPRRRFEDYSISHGWELIEHMSEAK